MLLPGTDPVSMLLELVPLLVLYEASVILAKAFGRPTAEVADREIAVSEA
jgi:Sec-independent protein secretion pathway component TatC